MNELAKRLLDKAKFYNFSKISCAMLLAQCDHESMGFTRLEENLNYSTADRILTVFRSRIDYLKLPIVTINKCVNNPQMLANTMYSNRMGNGNITTNDGFKYKGRGVIQLTGKSQYEAMDKYLNTNNLGSENLVTQPERAKIPEVAIKIACCYFMMNNLLDNDNVIEVTKKINGGINGLKEREELYKKYIQLV